MTEKSYFGCIDLRNAKFQGSIHDGQPDGLGLLLDNQHLFALSNWKNDVPYGPSLVIYPSRDYLYGKIKNRKLQQFCAFVKPTGVCYYFNFINGVSEKIAYCDGNNSVIQLVTVEGRLRAGEAMTYKGQAGKWKAVQQILGAVPEYVKGYRSYVHEMLEKQFYDVVQCSQISGMTFVGFKNTTSLGVKFDREERVRQVGNWQLFPRNLQFGRKYDVSSKGAKTEEGRFVQPERVFVYEQGRPAEALKFTEEYFKRGTNFKNAFFKMGVFEQICGYLRDVERQVVHLSFLQFGQKILEGREEEVEELRGEPYYRNKEYTVGEVKNEIYAAVQRRNAGGRRGSPLRASREKMQKGTELTQAMGHALNVSLNRQPSPQSRSKSKKYLYTDSIKKTGDQPLGLSQRKRLSEFQVAREGYSPKPRNNPYPVAAPTRPGVDVGQLFSKRYDHLHQQEDMLLREKLRQELLLDIARKNASPIRERRMTYSPSPYDGLKRGQAEINPKVERFGDNFTLGGAGHSVSQQQKFDHYIKYKNRDRSASKIGKEGGVESKEPNGYYPTKSLMPLERKVLVPRNASMADETKVVNVQAGGERQLDVNLPLRHKKIFKYL